MAAGRQPSPSGGVTPWQFAIEVSRQNQQSANRDARMAQQDKNTVAGAELQRQNAVYKGMMKGAGGGSKGKGGSRSSSESSSAPAESGEYIERSAKFIDQLYRSNPEAANALFQEYELAGEFKKGNSGYYRLKKRQSDEQIAGAAAAVGEAAAKSDDSEKSDATKRAEKGMRRYKEKGAAQPPKRDPATGRREPD